jgi:hypothetical protein
MAEESKFTGTLKRLRKGEKGPTMPEPTHSPVPTQTGAQRASGKRSDPQWRSITVLLKKQNIKMTRRRLEDEEEGKDLSTLIDELLTEWLAKKTGSAS